MQQLRVRPFPRKIWQVWRDDSEDPTERTVGFPRAWRAANPEHRYERLTDANVDTWAQAQWSTGSSPGENDKAVDLFVELNDPILRADFLRYLIMVREGGVWADIDVYPHQPIASWLPEGFREREDLDEDGEGRGNATAVVNLVVGIENDHNGNPIWPGVPYSVQLAQYVILAKPGHPALLALLDQVYDNLRALIESNNAQKRQQTQAHNETAVATAALEGLGVDRRSPAITFEQVMATTGPFAFTRALMEYFEQVTGIVHNGDELGGLRDPVLIGDVLVLPKDSFGWLPHDHTHEKGHSSILVEHLFMGSWRDTHAG